MLLMASSGFGIPQIAKNFPDSPAWRFFGYEFDHTTWTGCTLWDLIQPAFMSVPAGTVRSCAPSNSSSRTLPERL